MSARKLEIRYRVSGKAYCDAAEVERTSFVVGMLDMLSFTCLYAAPEHKPRFDAMMQEARKYNGIELRQRFDQYMSAVDDRQVIGAASCFFTALNKWSGYDN